MLKRIGAEEGGEFKAVASGTLPSGRPVIVNSDGTVSVVSSTAVSQTLASAEVFESAATEAHSAAYDSYNQRIVLAYMDAGNSNQGTAIVGTVNANNTVTYGSPVIFETGNTEQINALFDSTNNKIVIVYRDTTDSSKAKAIVGTVNPSDNSISFGSASSGIGAGTTDSVSAIFDSNAGKVVVAYRDTHNLGYGNSNVGTVSGTSITFGSSTYFETASTDFVSIGFDSSNNKVFILYVDKGNSDYPTAIVGTVSGTSISYGTAAVVQSAAASADTAVVYDSDAQKLGFFYLAVSEGKAAVATVSGTSISATVRSYAFESGAIRKVSAVYHQPANKIIIAYSDDTDGDKGKIALGRISGTDMLDPDGTMPSASGQGSPIEFENGQVRYDIGLVYDSVNKKAVISYTDDNNADYGTSRVFIPSYTENNLTSENYIGMSRGFTSPAVNGTKTTFDSNAIKSELTGSVYDPDTGKIIICYVRGSDSNGLAVVGTVDGATLSFGTPVVFNAAATEHTAITYDTSNDKVVIFYKDAGNSSYGTSIVGTVSGTSISFGSEVVFNSRNTQWTQATFDTNAGKVVVSYQDTGGTSDGKANVGTVSGTSISFGSQATFASTNASYVAATYDANAQKHVMCYRDNSASDYGKAVVGTVSGTNITFGSDATFNSANTSDIHNTFESTNNKVIIAYKDGGDSDKANAVVGTVSGTSISFGSEAVINSASTQQPKPVYNSVQQKLIFEYELSGNGLYYRTATVSGTSIADVSDEVTLASGFNALVTNFVYNPTADSAVVAFMDGGDSNKGNAIAFTLDSRAELANGQAASIDIIGSVSDNQSGLTAGQQYFVQNDGTISTTADSPSVLAGTAISATELVVKT